MKQSKLLIMAFALFACLLCSMSAVAQEAYVCFTPEDSTMTFYFDDLRSTRTGTTYNAYTDGNRPRWYYDGFHLKTALVVFDPSFADARPPKTAQWFVDFRNLRSIIGMEYLNMSEVRSVSWMFCDCEKLESIDLSHFNTANSTSLNRLFMGCKSLTSIDLSNFNTENVTDMAYMLGGCNGLTSLDLSPLNTQNVTTMEHMLSGLHSLESLDLSPLNTSKVKNMSGMLYAAKGLKSLDLSNFDTRNVTDMRDMFYYSYLTTLDLSSFNTRNVTNMDYMFAWSNIKTIYAGSEWSTEAVTSSENMFKDCRRLVGGRGTTFSSSHIDAEYAHLDGGPSNPGYFTAISKTGDVNGDAVVNITDVTTLLNALVNEDLSSIIEANADMNGDGVINITDVTMLVNLVLNSTR